MSDTETLVRDLSNEASTSAKWTTAKIRFQLEQSFALVIPEVFFNSDAPNSVRLDVTTTSGTNVYRIPPHVGEILMLAQLDSTGNIIRAYRPRDRWSAVGPGLHFDGKFIRFTPDWDNADTLSLWFIPSGEVRLFEATLNGSTQSTTSLVFTSASTGTIDTRTNAYAGYKVAVTDVGSGSAVSEALITASSFDGTEHTLTVEPALEFTPAASTDTLEVRPLFGDKLQMAVALQTAITILSAEGERDRESALGRRYAQVIRALRLEAANLDQIVGQHFQGGGMWSSERGLFT